MPNIVNKMVVRELTSEFKDAEGILAMSFGGLTVKRTEELRGQLAEKGVRFRMVRNSLCRRVLADRGVELQPGTLKGNTGLAYGDIEAIIGAAKVFADKEVKKREAGDFQSRLLGRNILGCRWCGRHR